MRTTVAAWRTRAARPAAYAMHTPRSGQRVFGEELARERTRGNTELAHERERGASRADFMRIREPPPVEECTMEDRLSDGCDAGQDEVDAGQELLAVVVPGQLRRHLTHERVFHRVELRPPCGDGREEGRSIRVGREEPGGRGVLSREAENVVQERGRAV